MTAPFQPVPGDDKYVTRARPTGLYVFYAVCVAITTAMIAGIKIDAAAILTIVGPLAGTGGYYIYNRTQEKLSDNTNGAH